MKKLAYIVLCIGLMACKEKREAILVEEKVIGSTEHWLTFEGSDENSKHIVLISGDEEYRSEEALPQLAKILSEHHGFKCTVLFAQDPRNPGVINANHIANISGLEALAIADMMVIFTRFRALPDEQMQYIDDYLKSGKPVMGIRTATHAFNFGKDSTTSFNHYSNGYSGDKSEWADGFGRLVLGEKWISHHGHHKHQSTRGLVAVGAESHPITNGIKNEDIWGSTDVYGIRLPLPGDSQPIILGQVINRKGDYDENDTFFGMKPTDTELAKQNNEGAKVNDILMPIAWTKGYQLPDGKHGRAFTSTIGSSSDMLNEGVRRLMVNGIFWAMDQPVPEKANVSIVGDFNPTVYGFQKDEFWIKKQMKIADLK